MLNEKDDNKYFLVSIRKADVMYVRSYMHAHSFMLTPDENKAQRFSLDEARAIQEEQIVSRRYKPYEIVITTEDEIEEGKIIGLKAVIFIDCETTDELVAHLHNILSRVKKERKKYPDKEFPTNVSLQFDDSNCYGTHEVVIEADVAD